MGVGVLFLYSSTPPGCFCANGCNGRVSDGPYAVCPDRANMTACLNYPSIAYYARTYAQAVAGTTQSFVFDRTTREVRTPLRALVL